MFYDSLLSLCLDKGIRVTNLVSILNISSGNLSKWKAGGVPKGDTLSKIADYFNVTTDYLLGRTTHAEPYPGAAESPPVAAHLLERIPQIAALKQYCELAGKSVSPILHYYQDPENNASLESILSGRGMKQKDNLSFERLLGCSASEAIQRVNGQQLLALTADEHTFLSAYRKVKEEQSAEHGHLLKIAGRDGTFVEVRLTDAQLEALRPIVEQLPDAGDL